MLEPDEIAVHSWLFRHMKMLVENEPTVQDLSQTSLIHRALRCVEWHQCERQLKSFQSFACVSSKTLLLLCWRRTCRMCLWKITVGKSSRLRNDAYSFWVMRFMYESKVSKLSPIRQSAWRIFDPRLFCSDRVQVWETWAQNALTGLDFGDFDYHLRREEIFRNPRAKALDIVHIFSWINGPLVHHSWIE